MSRKTNPKEALACVGMLVASVVFLFILSRW